MPDTNKDIRLKYMKDISAFANSTIEHVKTGETFDDMKTALFQQEARLYGDAFYWNYEYIQVERDMNIKLGGKYV